MKLSNLSLLALIVLLGVSIFLAFKYRWELLNLREENAALKVVRHDGLLLGDSMNKENRPPGGRDSENINRNLLDENQRLAASVGELTNRLAETAEQNALLESEPDRLLKPTRENILSSTLRTTIGFDEVVVTGG